MRRFAFSVAAAGCLLLAAQGIGVAAPAPQLSTDDVVKKFAPAPPVTRGINFGAATKEPSNNPTAPALGQPKENASLDLLLTFEFNSAQLTEQGMANAKVFAEALKRDELKGLRFQIEGYTDASGSADYNRTLSQRRAQAVREFLAAQGVDPERLKTVGHGSDELANPAKPLAAENRRVVTRLAQ